VDVCACGLVCMYTSVWACVHAVKCVCYCIVSGHVHCTHMRMNAYVCVCIWAVVACLRVLVSVCDTYSHACMCLCVPTLANVSGTSVCRGSTHRSWSSNLEHCGT
jgi:hypothetical protein